MTSVLMSSFLKIQKVLVCKTQSRSWNQVQVTGSSRLQIANFA